MALAKRILLALSPLSPAAFGPPPRFHNNASLLNANVTGFDRREQAVALAADEPGGVDEPGEVIAGEEDQVGVSGAGEKKATTDRAVLTPGELPIMPRCVRCVCFLVLL